MAQQIVFKKLDLAPKKKPLQPRRLQLPAPAEPDAPKPRKPKATPLEEKIIEDNGGAIDTLYVPEKPAMGEELFVFEVKRMTAVEHLMFKGIRSAHLIAEALGISEMVAEKYVTAVYARWETAGGEVDIKQQRGESLRYLDLLQNQLWSQYTKAQTYLDAEEKKPADQRSQGSIDRNRALLVTLNTQIMALNQQRTQLYGLNPQTVNNMILMGTGSENHEVLSRMKKQEGVRNIAVAFAEALAKRTAARQMREGGQVQEAEIVPQ